MRDVGTPAKSRVNGFSQKALLKERVLLVALGALMMYAVVTVSGVAERTPQHILVPGAPSANKLPAVASVTEKSRQNVSMTMRADHIYWSLGLHAPKWSYSLPSVCDCPVPEHQVRSTACRARAYH